MATKKKMQDGGPADAMLKAMGQKPTSTKKTLKYVRKHGSGYIPPAGKKMQSGGTSGGYPEAGGNTMSGGKMTPGMKTGGMVNPNAKLQAGKVAGSKGVTPGVNPKAAASKVAKGRSGGTSTAPKTALPKAQMGKIVKMASNAAKVAGKGAKKASGSVLDFRKAATKSDMSKAFSNVERAKLKKQLQDLDKAKKG
jgi:hypothetical protein